MMDRTAFDYHSKIINKLIDDYIELNEIESNVIAVISKTISDKYMKQLVEKMKSNPEYRNNVMLQNLINDRTN